MKSFHGAPYSTHTKFQTWLMNQYQVFYDTNCGHKKTVATCVETSPIRYSILRSTSPRFPNNTSHSVPFGTYNLDTAHKKTIESRARDNRRFYAATFDSSGTGRPWTSPTTDVMYNVITTCNGRPATVAHSLGTTSQNYAILRSQYPRLTNKLHTEGPDVIYDIDAGRKTSMHKSMLNSAIQYRNMRAQASEPNGKEAFRSSNHQKVLGPGSYDYKKSYEVCVSPYLCNRPLSSMMSRSPRFGKKKGLGVASLGSTWDQTKDDKAWSHTGAKLSQTQYLRPQYLPNYYKEKMADSSFDTKK